MNQTGGSASAERRLHEGACGILHTLLVITLTIILVAVPASAGAGSALPAQMSGTGPETVTISIYVVDFNRFDVDAGTVGIDCYINLKSDTPVSLDDFELMNGMITSVSPIIDTPEEKEYRVIAVLTAEPDLSRYPFDRHILTINLEPKLKNEQEMIFVIDKSTSALDPEADLPGWEFTGISSYISNNSYIANETPFSRADFDYGITRSTASTILKFFLPILLIIIVSLSSLMMKTSSRLGLNASMFLAAVLIHWRVADAIPVVAYATFLDLFMIITYATLVMVLISGILILKYTESGDTAIVDRINFWSLRIIPALSITFYFLLFLSLA